MEQAALDTISDKIKQRIGNKNLSLPMLPQVTNRVLSLVNDVDSDAAALAKLIQSDQALAGHVMRIANSATYSPTTKMTSLQQATARLGMRNISDIAMAATMGPKLFQVPGFESMVKDLWHNSLATAVWSREIARQCRRNVETSFLCGLLFQIGKPVVLQTSLEIATELDVAVDPDGVNKLIELFQKEVGLSVAEHWQLPEAVSFTIAGKTDKSCGAADIVDIIAAAQAFSQITVQDRQYDSEQLAADSRVVDVNLYVDDVEQLLGKSDAVHETIEALSL